MKQNEPIDEKIAAVIYKKVTGNILKIAEENDLKRWISSSPYYRSLVEAIETDRHLKNKLLEAYSDNKGEFWKIVITYRAALP